MWLKLTDHSTKQQILLNGCGIVEIGRLLSDDGSYLMGIGDQEFSVRESPEQIAAMLAGGGGDAYRDALQKIVAETNKLSGKWTHGIGMDTLCEVSRIASDALSR